MKIQFSFGACLQFCYTTLLQRELYEVSCLWNTHRIRPYPNQDTPAGKPDMLFFLPEITGELVFIGAFADFNFFCNYFTRSGS